MRAIKGATGDRVIPAVRARLTAVAVEEAAGAGVRPSRSERGMVSAEWAVGIIAAVAIAGVLLSVVTSGPVESAILKFILQVIRAFSGGLSSL